MLPERRQACQATRKVLHGTPFPVLPAGGRPLRPPGGKEGIGPVRGDGEFLHDARLRVGPCPDRWQFPPTGDFPGQRPAGLSAAEPARQIRGAFWPGIAVTCALPAPDNPPGHRAFGNSAAAPQASRPLLCAGTGARPSGPGPLARWIVAATDPCVPVSVQTVPHA